MSCGSHTESSARSSSLGPVICPSSAMCLAIAEGWYPTGPCSPVSQEVGSRTRLSLSWWLELWLSNVATLGAIFPLCALTGVVQWFSKCVDQQCELVWAPSPGNWWKTQILRSLFQPSDLASLERSPAMYILTGPPSDSDTHQIGIKGKRDLGNMTDGKERGNFYGSGNLPALNSWYPAMFLSLALVRYL